MSKRWRIILRTSWLAVSLVFGPGGPADAQTTECPGHHWVTAWSAPVDWADREFPDATLRMPIRPNWGGDTLRVKMSNELGVGPATLSSIFVARRATGPNILPETQVPIAFGGANQVVIPAGVEVVSDAIQYPYDQFEELVISFYSDATNGNATGHQWAAQVTYAAHGVNMPDAAGSELTWIPETAWFYVAGVDVIAPADVSNLVLYGDSITEGFGSTYDAHQRYPDQLAERMAALGLPLAVVNEGLSGNRVTHDGVPDIGGGLNAIDRFTRDVGSVADPTTVVILVGINDIGHPSQAFDPEATVEPPEIIAGLEEIVGLARDLDLAAIGGTLTPSGDLVQPSPLGPYYSSPEANAKRAAVNDWIRTTDVFDWIIDFDETIRDPLFPEHIFQPYNSGDNLHPGDLGYGAMADAIDLASLPVRSAAVLLAISPPAALVRVGRQAQFDAYVNCLGDESVTWSVQEPDGGTIDANGLYTAPSQLNASRSATVVATSVADPGVTTKATVRLRQNAGRR